MYENEETEVWRREDPVDLDFFRSFAFLMAAQQGSSLLSKYIISQKKREREREREKTHRALCRHE